MTNIAEGHPDFKTFERTIFEIMCQITCGLIREYLEWRDLSIMGLRDRKEYRYVEKRTATVKTLVGEVAFSRVYYKKKSGGYVFLLDEAMGIYCDCGLVSENLAEQVVAECSDKSFRKAAGSIKSFTGQAISAMGVWGAFQKYGETLEQQVSRLKELDDGGSTGHLGEVSSPVVFDEFDDVWISRQRDKRRKRVSDIIEIPKSDRDISPLSGILKTGETRCEEEFNCVGGIHADNDQNAVRERIQQVSNITNVRGRPENHQESYRIKRKRRRGCTEEGIPVTIRSV